MRRYGWFAVATVSALFAACSPTESGNGTATGPTQVTVLGSTSTSGGTMPGSTSTSYVTTSGPSYAPPPTVDTSACVKGASALSYHESIGTIRYVGATIASPLDMPVGGGSPEEIARSYLAQCGSLFGLKDQKEELSTASSEVTPDERAVVRFQQMVGTIPVLSGELIVQISPEGRVLSVTGEVLPSPAVAASPKIGADVAAATALADTALTHGVEEAELKVSEAPTLAIFSPKLSTDAPASDSQEVLTWRVGVQLPGGPIDQQVYVDAGADKVVFSFNLVDVALSRVVNDANNSATVTQVRTEGGAASTVTEANTVYASASDVWSWYWNQHRRDGVSGTGSTIVQTVRYCPPRYPCPYSNAYWSSTEVFYGQGFGVDDITAHELTHGVTQFESNLTYSGSSGAINESFSDLWGEAIDQSNGRGNDTTAVRWLFGEDRPSGASRSMSDPGSYPVTFSCNAVGYQPTVRSADRLTSPNYFVDSCDNGGVHFNSGVNNKAAYLIGTTETNTFNGVTVKGIGLSKMTRVYYEAQANLLTSGANYNALYDAVNQGCSILVGVSPPSGLAITTGDCVEVRKALQAVEMNHRIQQIPAGFAVLGLGRHQAGGFLFGSYTGWGFSTVPVPSTAKASLSNTVAETLVNVAGLGGVRDSGSGVNDAKLTVYSNGQVVEWAIWYGGTYRQGEVPVNGSAQIDIPHYTSFSLSIARPSSSMSAWVFARENDGQLFASVITQAAPTALMADSAVTTLSEVAGVGGIRDTGVPSKNRVLAVFNSGSINLAYSLWSGTTMTSGSVAPGATAEVTFPHYQAFMLWYGNGPTVRVIFARENDNRLVANVATSSATTNANDNVAQTLLAVANVGGLRDLGDADRDLWRYLDFYSAPQSPLEWSIWQPNLYTQGESAG